MRNLTIKRSKRFVASLGKMYVYIEDPTCNEYVINGFCCRKLGILKNGEEATYQIENTAAKVYVMGNVSPGVNMRCDEFYQIYQGDEDIYLSGRNYYNPFAGNPFRFDGITDVNILEARKKQKRTSRIINIVLISVIVLTLAVNGVISLLTHFIMTAEMHVECEELNVTLTMDFIELDKGDYDFVYGNGEYTVFGYKDDTFEDAESCTVNDYGEFFIEYVGFDSSHKLKYKDGLTYMEYEMNNGGSVYHYWVFFFRGPNNFWVVNIASVDTEPSKAEPKVMEFAKTITFDSAE